jgi:hypothetical protein
MKAWLLWTIIALVIILIWGVSIGVIVTRSKPDSLLARAGGTFPYSPSSPIPKTIYICYKTKDALPQKVSRRWKELNPGYTVEVYGDEECEKFIRETYGQDHAKFFRSIPDGPIRADFWRVCIIYAKGGVYVDADVEPLVPIDKILDDDTDLLTCATYKESQHPCINPHIIAARSGHPLIKECVDKMVAKASIPYSYWGYSITRVMYEVLKEAYPSLRKNEEGRYFSENHGHLHLIEEIFPSRGRHSVYCQKDGKRVLNNRWKDYDPYNHTFL